MSSAEALAERRRLRRQNLLANSEKRLNRIMNGGTSEHESITSDSCDNHQTIRSETASPVTTLPSLSDEQFNNPVFQQWSQSATTNKPQVLPNLPPRENEALPRKVSLISSPIHYKTLQRSKQYNSMLNHPNIVNNLRCNSSAIFMLILIVLGLVSSFFNANIPMLFASYLLCKHAYNGLYRNVWFDINITVFKELFTFMFSYILTQVTVKMVSN